MTNVFSFAAVPVKAPAAPVKAPAAPLKPGANSALQSQIDSLRAQIANMEPYGKNYHKLKNQLDSAANQQTMNILNYQLSQYPSNSVEYDRVQQAIKFQQNAYHKALMHRH